MSPDDLCEKYSTKGIKLNIEKKDDFILIEGDSITLEFLGNLLIAQAKFIKDTGFQLSPSGAGKIFFAKKTKIGLYINRK